MYYNIVRKFAGVGYDLWFLSDNFITHAYSKKGNHHLSNSHGYKISFSRIQTLD